MKRLIASTLIGVLALSLNLLPATAAVKPGATCKKIGQISTSVGIKYKCIKSGKKLVWNKVVVVKKAPPPAAPTPPQEPLPPTPSPVILSELLSLSGVQKMNLPTEYVGQTPFAKILFRWPIPSNTNLGGYVISYQDKAMYSPPCDLTKGLCEGPRKADEKIYDLVVTDSKSDKVEIGSLKIDNSYEFKFCYVIGDVQALQNVGSLCWSQGFSVFLNTDTQKVPQAPAIVAVGLSKAIEVELQSQVPNGYRVNVIVSGGQFGVGTTAATLANPGKVRIEASSGLYIVVAIMETPSGINGNPSSSFQVNVSP
jgi:hypothetical protein